MTTSGDTTDAVCYRMRIPHRVRGRYGSSRPIAARRGPKFANWQSMEKTEKLRRRIGMILD